MDNKQFRNTIKDILNHISDTAYLENNNLAELLLTGDEAKQTNRVQLLRNKITESINILRPPDDTPKKASEWRCYRILTLRYLSLKEFYMIETELGLSQRQVQRDLKKGIDALTSILWKQFSAINQISEQDELSKDEDEPHNLDLIKEELKNWEITFGLYNLSQILEQALQLCKSFLKTDLYNLVDMENVDKTQNIMIDQVLTKQGLYKTLTVISSSAQNHPIQIASRKINENFIELTFNFESDHPLNDEDWQIAQLFFTIQGLTHEISKNKSQTNISIILPLTRQNCCLVIDDVASVRRLIERMLAPYGIQVFGADQLQEALNLAQLVNPDFILLDVLMPKMDGWQMIEHLKVHPETNNIPIIICSVLVEPELAKAVGAAAYVRKPINRLELIQTLEKAGLIKEN